MSQSRSTSQSVDRRQFVKGAIASTAALGMIPVGKACAITYDANGKLVDWLCIIDVVTEGNEYTIYVIENCRTGELIYSAQPSGLPIGDCAAPTYPACIAKESIGRFEQVRCGEHIVAVSPDLSVEARTEFDKAALKLAQILPRI